MEQGGTAGAEEMVCCSENVRFCMQQNAAALAHFRRESREPLCGVQGKCMSSSGLHCAITTGLHRLENQDSASTCGPI